MAVYNLYLDESGQFRENISKSKASIVAGFLTHNWQCTEERATALLQQVKDSDKKFSDININHFHAMEINNPNVSEFIVRLIEFLSKKKSRVVVFKSQKDYVIVNSDVTYLNVFAEGIFNLVHRLLAQTDEEIVLNVMYASRLNVDATEVEKLNSRIEERAYTERIEERLTWRMLRLNSTDRRRVQINLSVGIARTLKSLMLADAICFALRGGIRLLNVEQKARVRTLQYDTISQLIRNLIEVREYDAVNHFIDVLEDKIFPLLKSLGVEYEEFYFDVHFYRLTVATHQGNTLEEQREINTCRKILPTLPATCETLDYYLKYKLREVEHLKNIYDFEKAIDELDSLEQILSNMVSLVQMIEELGEFGKNIRSTTLGKVIGSRTAVKIYLSHSKPNYLSAARKDSDAAIEHFTKESDKARQYQLRSMLETRGENFKESLKWLGKAFGAVENASPEEVLKHVMTFKGFKAFGLLHYANLMSAAMSAGNSLAKKMYNAWINQNAEEVLPKDRAYPSTLILHRIGKCKALKGTKNAKKYYDLAVKTSLENPNNLTHYAAGLIIEADQIVTLNIGNDIRRVLKLYDDYKKFAALELPQSMRTTFAGFALLEQKTKNESVEAIKNYLANFVRRTPLI